MENLYDKRKSYEKFELVENQIEKDPLKQFALWYQHAEETEGDFEANAMAISTIEPDGCPRTRMVLLKSFNEDGFVFYTNYSSKKGKALEGNNMACLHFFWALLERQVIIKAHLEKVPEEVSKEYFSSRPRGSQIGAVVSPQSSEIPNREFLEEKVADLEKSLEGKEIEKPEQWGGYLAKPYEIEFWQGRANRLHDRILYELQEDNTWRTTRLAP